MFRIAICDDSKADIEQLETVLDALCSLRIDYDVYCSAVELLECMVMHRETYHLYIFDIEMPHMTGLELAKEIRKIDTNALFVFLTGYDQYVMDVFKVVTFDGTYGHLYPNSNLEVANKLTGVLTYTPASHSIADYTSNQHTAIYHKEVK